MRKEVRYQFDVSAARGKEVCLVKPVILGGSPTDFSNKVVLTRDEHIKSVRYWNRIIHQLRGSVSVRRQNF